MRAALYARYSMEKQSEASIDDQLRVCERIAERNGFTVAARFSDAAITGGTVERPGYRALLEAARRHEFDVIVAEDTSRLWRLMAEQAPRLAELADLGVQVVTHDVDTRQESAAVLSAVIGSMAEQYRKEIGRRTRRGLEGRARAGKPAGGKAYGYIPAARSGTGHIEINEAEAKVVRRIFGLYADGKSPRAIADVLNQEGVKSPGASWARSERRSSGWIASALNGDGVLTGILHNPLYRGEVVWNRFRWIRSATDSHRRRRVENPRAEWIVRQEERLRIVPEELWRRVSMRRRQRSREVGDRVARGLSPLGASRTGRAPRYLLSGLLRCSLCGATYQLNGAMHYACSSHLNGGPSCCGNNARLHREKAQQGVVDGIRRQFRDPTVIEEGARRVRAIIKAASAKPRADKPESRIRGLKEQIANLTDAIAQGMLRSSPAIAAKLRAAEDELATLAVNPARQLADVEQLLPRLEDEMRGAIEDLVRTLESGDVDLARQELKGYLGSVRVVAEPSRMLLFSERNVAEAVIARAARGNMASINGSGGRI